MECQKIGALTSSASGTTPIREKQKIYYTDGSHLWVKTTDLNNNFIRDTSEKVTQRALDETSCKLLPKNTVLVAMYGGFNQIGRTGLLTKEAACNQALTGIAPNDGFDSRYLQEVLNLRTFYWKKFAASSRKDPNITRNDVMQFPVPHSNKTEEIKIVEILSTWDKAIELKEELIEEKKEFKRGLMQKLLTGDMRFPEFTDAWEEKRLNDILKVVTRNEEWDDEKLYNLVSVRRRSGGVFYRGELFGYQIKTKNLVPIKKNDFLISKMQVVHGALGLVENDFENYYVSDSYIILQSKEESLNIKFFNYLTQMPFMYHKTYISSYGVHIEKMTFNLKLYLKEKVFVPSEVKEQKKIVQILDLISTENMKLMKELNQLKEQKRGLMQLLLTGIVRVEVN
jgi:type I restriction enzyme S subunit